MTDKTPKTFAERKLVDKVCDLLESDWKAGQQSELEDYVARLGDSCTREALTELVILEAWYRGRSEASNTFTDKSISHEDELTGETLWAGFVRRFPQLESVTTPAEFRDSSVVPQTFGERFRSLRHCASGGLGRVSIARDLQFNRDVAVKEMLPRFASLTDYRDRFLREAEITGQLEHPCIVPVYVMGQLDNGEPWYAMRFVSGDSLLCAINKSPSFALEAELTVQKRGLLQRFVDVCRAVDYAHSCGVIHRDIKPQNIMLGNYGETFLVDWGMAKKLGDSEKSLPGNKATESTTQTQVGTVMGTPAYMSPEQSSGAQSGIDQKSDIYSLGATLFHLLNGRAPGTAQPCNGLPTSHADPDDLGHRSFAHRPLQAICNKAMASIPSARYGSAGELAKDVELALADQSTSAYSDPLFTIVRRWVRQHLAWTTAIAAGLGVSFLALIAISWINAANASQLLAKNLQLDNSFQTEKGLRLAAEQSEKDTTDAMDYLVNTLRSPDPNRSGRDVRVADVLQQSIAQLDEDFRDESVLKARLLSAIGQTLVGLGMVGEAQPVVERSWAMCQNLLGDDDRLTLNAKYSVALVYWRMADSRGKPMMKELVDKGQKILGAEDPDTLNFEASLAVLQMESGDPAEAIRFFREQLPIVQRIFGKGSVRVLTAKNHLANAYYFDGQLEKAVELSESVYEGRTKMNGPNSYSAIMAGSNYVAHLIGTARHENIVHELEDLLNRARKHLGNDHFQTLILLSLLGASYLAQNDMVRGLPLLEESLTRSEALYGSDHPRTLVAANGLGVARLQRGDYTDSIRQLKRVYDASVIKRGEDHPESLTVANNLASAYYLDKQYEHAIKLFESTLSAQRHRQGNHHPNTIRSIINLAATMQKAKRTGDSIPLGREALQLASDHLDPDHMHCQTALTVLGTGYLELQEFKNSRDAFEKCLEIRIRKMPGHYLRYHSMSQLGEAYAAMNQFEKAEPLLLEAWEGLQERQAQVPGRARHRIVDARRRLVDLYEAMKLPEKAAAYRQPENDSP